METDGGMPAIQRRKLLEVIQSFIRNMVRKWPHDEWKLAMNKNKIALLRRKIMPRSQSKRRSRNLPWARNSTETSIRKRDDMKQSTGCRDFTNYCLQYQWDLRDSGALVVATSVGGTVYLGYNISNESSSPVHNPLPFIKDIIIFS